MLDRCLFSKFYTYIKQSKALSRMVKDSGGDLASLSAHINTLVLKVTSIEVILLF